MVFLIDELNINLFVYVSKLIFVVMEEENLKEKQNVFGRSVESAGKDSAILNYFHLLTFFNCVH